MGILMVIFTTSLLGKMKRPDFEIGDYVCALGVSNKVLTISEVEYFKELDDYVYYTLDGQSFGNLQLEPIEIVFNREYEKHLREQEMTREKMIEEILIEASSYGLKTEVIETASEYQKDGMDRLQAFEEAFKEWIK
jgi:hypothetical protein